MSLLQYTSEEMFSSTELIRKSKMVFDKISNHNIEKAIILRDGKPSFILLDFHKYEELIREYMKLQKRKDLKVDKKEISRKKGENSNEALKNDINLTEDDLKNALDDIDNLDIVNLEKSEKKEVLKDFWD